MAILGIILLGVVAFVVMGLLGWVIKALGWGFDFLGEGVRNFFGCFLSTIFWIAILMCLIMVI